MSNCEGVEFKSHSSIGAKSIVKAMGVSCLEWNLSSKRFCV